MSLLEVKNLSKSFGGLNAINDVSLNIGPSEIVALIGPNGAGKTTLLNLLTNFISPDKGDVVFNGKPLQGKARHTIVKIGMARTFQSLTVFENLTVLENVNIGNSPNSPKMMTYLLSTPKARSEMRERNFARIRRCLDQVSLEPACFETMVSELSMIDKKKVAIASALASEPKLLLLDEPMAGLNQEEAQQILNLIRILKQKGVSTLLIDHNLEAILSVAERVYVLNFGVVVYEGMPSEIVQNKTVIRIYLGE
jgi:branched-chain amino acid transport system ATP-binding protein